MKKKITLTFSEELADNLSALSKIMCKNQNSILEDAYWEWWQRQDVELKHSLDEMLKIMKKVKEA